jgi:sodium-dependent dicarboxylate transporter 2/3/5
MPPQTLSAAPPEDLGFSMRQIVGGLLGPLLGVALWYAPLAIEASPRHALAIVLFMVVYWIAEPIHPGLTALIGCYLFWALNVTKFEVAFSGFADNTPWFLFGAMLLGEAASRSGLAKRLAFVVMRVLGTSYRNMLLSLIVFVFLLNFLVPSGLAQLAIVAPIAVGILQAFEASRRGNIARGLFVILTYCAGLFNKMLLTGGASILTRGLVEKFAGKTVYWSQYLIAFLPASLLTIVACWLLILWLYPAEIASLPGGRAALRRMTSQQGPWTPEQKKSLFWLLLAVALWSTDMLHHISPAVIALGIGLLVTLPGIGVLKTKDIRGLNFLLIIFIGGTLGMGEVLIRTKAIDLLSKVMIGWMAPLLTGAWAASTLYWAGFLYHFLLASEFAMLSTLLPVLLKFAKEHALNPVAVAMIFNFASGGKLFLYQSGVLMLGYGFGYFETKDLFKVGLALTVFEGLVLLLLVPLYWPLIGLHLTQ